MTDTALRPPRTRGARTRTRPTAAGVATETLVRQRRGPGRRRAQRASETQWSHRYSALLAWTDVLAVVLATATAQWIRFGASEPRLDGRWIDSDLSYSVVSVLLAVAWLAFLGGFRTRSRRVVAEGVEEYRRVVTATLALFGTVAIVAYLTKVEIARGFLATALPLGLLGLLASRWTWRRWLAVQRTRGRALTRVLVVGGHDAAVAMAATFERCAAAGYRVVGVCVPGHEARVGGTLDVDGHVVPVLGDQSAVLAALELSAANMVAVTNTEALGLRGMRDLGWQLESVDVDMVVSPGVIDVAGPRLNIRPVAGLPLLHVEEPQYHGASRFRKTALDVSAAALGLVVAAPVMLALALAVKATSRGPVLYRSERIGRGGQPFPMLKFRSMVADADARLEQLVGSNQGAGPLFKMKADPRVTRVGRLMRKLSLDELPQLVNVLRLQMSLVGPRPPLRSEVDAYEGEVHRRLLVRPGITGLWQVSGRSDLPWEEAVRLDLSYVENWSVLQDLVIIARTLKAVLWSRGAY